MYAGSAVLVVLLALLYMITQLSRASGVEGGEGDTADGGDIDDRTTLGRRVLAGAMRRATGAAMGKGRKRGPIGTLLSRFGGRTKSAGTVAKILLAYVQVLSAFTELPSIAWPSLFTQYLEHLSLFSFQLWSAAPFGCLVEYDVTYSHELMLMLVLPLLGAIVVLLIAWLAAQCTLPKGERGLWAVAARPETCTLQLWLMLLLYPSLAKTALTPYDCVAVGDRELLRANPAVACDEAAYGRLTLLGFVGTLAYSFGFPLLCFLVTRSAHRASRAEMANEEDAEAEDGSDDDDDPVALKKKKGAGVANERMSTAEGFARARLLLQSYKAGFWYWESLNILRKYFLTSVVLVMAHDTLLQVYLGLLVCIISGTLVARHQPYADPLCGRLQMLALTQLTFTYMSGMLFFDDGDGSSPCHGAKRRSARRASGGGA